MQLEAYSHVVLFCGRELKAGIDAWEALPPVSGGTLSGAPAWPRRSHRLKGFSWAVWWAVGLLILYTLDSCITIRSILYKNGCYYSRSRYRAVIPFRSVKMRETYHKARALMVGIKGGGRACAVDD